jgi:hypothetical protein
VDTLLEQDDHAGDEVRHDVLQADPNADAERAGEDRDTGEVESERRGREQKPDEDHRVVQEDGQGVRLPVRQPASGVDLFAQHESHD